MSLTTEKVEISYLFPIEMIAKLEWTQSNAQQNIEQLQNPTMGVTINNNRIIALERTANKATGGLKCNLLVPNLCPRSPTHRRAIKEESNVANHEWVEHQACSMLQYINVIASLFIMGIYFNKLSCIKIKANNLFQFIHQVTIKFRFRKSLAQERLKSNLEFSWNLDNKS